MSNQTGNMSSSIDDNIELIALNSPSSTKSYIKTKLKIKDNNVGSSPNSSPVHSDTKNETHNLFLAKSKTPQPKPRLLPVPIKRHKRRSSRTNTDATSESQDTLESTREKPSGDELTESIFSSRSDTRSQREKFKDRFESVRKQAGKSVSKAHTFKSKAEKIRGLKRSLNLLKKENEEIDVELKNYEKNKKPNEEDNYLDEISKIEAYNFFCGENEPEFNEENNKNSVSENLSNLGKSTEVLITVPEKDENEDDVHFLPATNLEFNIKLSENDQFWQPSRKRLEVSEKLETDEPRLLAKEGFFVDQKPRVPASHLNILERRLLSTDDKKWFNCEGELEILPNPYTSTSYRPDLFFQKNQQLETEYVAPTIDPTLTENILVPHNNILDISILGLKFKHHPLFSPEHVFEQKLITLYDNYKQKLNTNKLERISKRLDSLRNAKNNIEAALNANKGDLKKLNSYREEIKKLRELHFEEGRQSRIILKSILETWKTIKKIRQTNTYSSTRIKLNIRKEKCNPEQEMHLWNAKIEETCAEIISEQEFDFQTKISNYKIELEQWKQHLQNEKPIEEEDIPKKPRKPVKNIDHEIIVHEMVEKFKESFKPPGEPILHFTLSYDNEVADKFENSKEKLRRNAVTTTKIYLRVLCNKIEVCKSKTISLTDKFACIIDETFSLQLSIIPENIVIEIHEQPSTLMKRKLGEVKIMVPSKNITMVQNKTIEQHFQKDEIVHYKHVGVGSGIELKNIFPEATNEEGLLYTSGVLTCKLGWDASHCKDFEENTTTNNHIIKSVLNEDGTIDVNKLIEWANENNPDPQDPKNSVLYEYIKNYDQDFGVIPSTTKAYFRCNPGMLPFEFCDSKDIEENLRFQILELRDRNEPEFVGMVVPNRLKEIPLDILADYKRRRDEENKNLMEDDYDFDEDEIDSKRSHGRKYLKQVYTKVFQQCRNTKNNLVYEDVVNEKTISYIENLTRNILSYILSWFQFQPTINILPRKSIRKTSAKSTDLNAPVKITICVKSAVNVPLRSTVRTSRSDTDTNNAEEITVKPFITVTYQNINLQTTSKEGTNPVWNEELILPLESTNTDYLSPNSLSGSLIIRLFDEIIVKGRDGEVKAKNWLGSIEIPVSAIAYNNKMEGLFKVLKPGNLLGYEQGIDENYSNSKTQNNTQQQAGFQFTYLSLKLSLQPHVPKLTQSMDELETTELPYIKQHILNWNEAYNNEYPNRKFSALAIDINGKTTCVTRFIRPLEPPQLNRDSFDVSADQCARYVSMIPFTDNNKFYQNVWLSTEQLLKLMIGSVIDHAIALTCYLTSLEIETWLLLGYGLPHGTTAYVLIREYNREPQIPVHFIYDIVTATKYDITDTFCPLQKIFCVINKNNVWANIQRTDQIQLTRLDFLRRSDWLPLFNNQITAPTNSIQQKLIYTITPDIIKQLEIRIDKKIRKKFAKLRKHERTVWNHQLSRAFRNAVAKCETGSMHGRRNSELFADIKNFTLTHTINGYIVNMTYTSISTIIAAVISTRIHLHEGPDTEFSLVVEIYSYPNHVLAVWICLATITRKQS